MHWIDVPAGVFDSTILYDEIPVTEQIPPILYASDVYFCNHKLFAMIAYICSFGKNLDLMHSLEEK